MRRFWRTDRSGSRATVSTGAPADDAAASAELRLVRGLRVLLIDEQEESRRLLAGTLSYYGADVTAVASVSAAVDAVDACNPQVVVSHCTAPTADDFRLIQRVRALESARRARIHMIALVAEPRVADLRVASAGFHLRLPAALDRRELVAVLGRLVSPASAPA